MPLNNPGDVQAFSYTGGVQSVSLAPGQYKIQMWGAQGGASDWFPGAKGGYTEGILSLITPRVLYVVVGQQGASTMAHYGNQTWSYNGGGSNNAGKSYKYGNGGGATHCAFETGVLSSLINVKHQVCLVAGGGAGGARQASTGVGGGLNGGDSYSKSGLGGTQTAGGASCGAEAISAGSFGQGGGNNSARGSGGGGGWYGGGSGSYSDGSGGGSSYIAPFITNGNTIAGDSSMPSISGSTEVGHEGHGYVKITLVSKKQYEPLSVLGGEQYFTYTGAVQPVNLAPGLYTLEVWGAQGGTMTPNWTGVGGKGGYAKGTIAIASRTTLYVYVGGQGTGYCGLTNHPGGWNGGGTCYKGASGGGGATDVSLYANSNLSVWNCPEHLNSRIIVAGGGGGSNDNQDGGFGGGLAGGTGVNGATGGTQTTGGEGWLSGEFGIGAGAANAYGDGGAGGGGWYGGGKAEGLSAAGGGGSGYALTYNSHRPSGYLLLSSTYYLTDITLLDGTKTFPSPVFPDKTEIGHMGHGYAKITNIGLEIVYPREKRLNSNIYKNIFPEEVFDVGYIESLKENITTSYSEIKQINHGFQINDVIAYSSSKGYFKPLASSTTKNIVGIVSSIRNANICTIMSEGQFDYPSLDFTDTTILYLSDKIPGKLVHYKDIENMVYIPIAIYTGKSIIVNILAGSHGGLLVPYESSDTGNFERYDQTDLQDIIDAIIGG